MHEVRFAVEEVSGGKVYDHRLMSFNNDAVTSFADIGRVFEVTRKAIKGRLACRRNAPCDLNGSRLAFARPQSSGKRFPARG